MANQFEEYLSTFPIVIDNVSRSQPYRFVDLIRTSAGSPISSIFIFGWESLFKLGFRNHESWSRWRRTSRLGLPNHDRKAKAQEGLAK